VTEEGHNFGHVQAMKSSRSKIEERRSYSPVVRRCGITVTRRVGLAAMSGLRVGGRAVIRAISIHAVDVFGTKVLLS
jgi:hypothetical protein